MSELVPVTGFGLRAEAQEEPNHEATTNEPTRIQAEFPPREPRQENQPTHAPKRWHPPLMACFQPRHGYRHPTTGRFRPGTPLPGAGPLTIACGQCEGCRTEQAREWAIRIMHEAHTHDRNCFLTLTYRDDALPPGGVLRPRDYQEFMNRLRSALHERGMGRVRYYQCGEYSPGKQRPHHHAAIFGQDFRQDMEPMGPTRSGHPQWTSPMVERAWRHGRISISDLTPASAAYVSRYVCTKRTGPAAESLPEHICLETGEYFRQPEYATMSTKPGIGRKWIDRYHDQVLRRDAVVHLGKEQKPPRYYDRMVKPRDLHRWTRNKVARIDGAADSNANDPSQLAARKANFEARKRLRSPRDGS